MHAVDILRYGHQTVEKSVDGLSEADWEKPGVAGVWTVKDIIGHLASFEQVLIDILRSLQGETPSPVLDRFINSNDEFNAEEVARRREQSVAGTWAEYENASQRSIELMAQIPEDLLQKTGVLAWYGAEYDLEDFIVYSLYGHKREHSAHLSLFRDTLPG
jgi:hypothetical protein